MRAEAEEKVDLNIIERDRLLNSIVDEISARNTRYLAIYEVRILCPVVSLFGRKQ